LSATTDEEKAPRVSIIVRAWGEQKLTNACLDSIEEYTPEDDYELILVDQESAGNSECGARWPLCDFVVCTKVNLGAVTATNLGLQIAMTRPSDLVLILDNDTRIPGGDTGWLERWIHHFDDEEIGAAGAVTDYVSGPQNISVTPRTHTKAVERDGKAVTQTGPIIVPWLISFACMYRKKALLSMPASRHGSQEIAGMVRGDGTLDQSVDDWQMAHLWDERFNPGNWEDIDVSVRMETRGWKLTVARDVYIHHRGSVTFNKGDFQGLLAVNQEKGREKWGERILEQLQIMRRVG